MAVQVFYPDFYNGAYAACPDPIDFRAYTVIDIYKDTNAFYTESFWKQHAAARKARWPRPHRNDASTESSRRELVMGTHGRSGDQWDIWQAVYSPVGAGWLSRGDLGQAHGRDRSQGRRVLARELRPDGHPAARLGDAGSARSCAANYISMSARWTTISSTARCVSPRNSSRTRRIRRTKARSTTDTASSIAGTAIRRSAERDLAPALSRDVPAEDRGAHSEDGAGGRGPDELELLSA